MYLQWAVQAYSYVCSSSYQNISFRDLSELTEHVIESDTHRV